MLWKFRTNFNKRRQGNLWVSVRLHGYVIVRSIGKTKESWQGGPKFLAAFVKSHISGCFYLKILGRIRDLRMVFCHSRLSGGDTQMWWRHSNPTSCHQIL